VEIISHDHSRADDHLDRILSPTIFSTPTNRRIFRGMVYATDAESWQRVLSFVIDNSRWDLPDAAVGSYLERSYDYIVDLFMRLDRSEPFGFDPSGDSALREAKRVRGLAMREGGHALARAEAVRHFGMPAVAPGFAAALPSPLYPPIRDASN
jgi:hypothetical protein